MRPVLWGLLGFVVCLPLAFVLHDRRGRKVFRHGRLHRESACVVSASAVAELICKRRYGKDLCKRNRSSPQIRPRQLGRLEPPLPWRLSDQYKTLRPGSLPEVRISTRAHSTWNYQRPRNSRRSRQRITAPPRTPTPARSETIVANDATSLRNMARAGLAMRSHRRKRRRHSKSPKASTSKTAARSVTRTTTSKD